MLNINPGIYFQHLLCALNLSAQDKSKVTTSKKIVIANDTDQALITVSLASGTDQPLANQKIKIEVISNIPRQRITCPKEITTDINGRAVFAVRSKSPGFAEFRAVLGGTTLKDKTYINFAPNIFFRNRQKENKDNLVLDMQKPSLSFVDRLKRDICLSAYLNPVYKLYEKLVPRVQWQPAFSFPWAPVEINLIGQSIGQYRGVTIHHNEQAQSVRNLEQWAHQDYFAKRERYFYLLNLSLKHPGDQKIQAKLLKAYDEYDKAFCDFPYNFYIGSARKRNKSDDGVVYELRSLEKRPAHVGRDTGVSIVDKEMIGIVVSGNYQKRQPSQDQVLSLEGLIIMLAYTQQMDLAKNYPEGSLCLNNPNITEFKSVTTGRPVSWLAEHRAFKIKTCPGNMLVKWLNQNRPRLIEAIRLLNTED